jgi:hypothetical protein
MSRTLVYSKYFAALASTRRKHAEEVGVLSVKSVEIELRVAEPLTGGAAASGIPAIRAYECRPT